jgi:hypothetical protein
MSALTLKPTIKQDEAYQALMDDTHEFIIFGGGAGGGKSWLGCEWLMVQAIRYPNTRWFIGRKQLSNLMASTYLTWVKVCRYHKFEDWTLNGQQHFIQLGNGSRIDLVDLKYNPSDPLYEDLGSYEFTGGFIEEAGEIDFKAFDVLKSRVGRQMNKEYGIRAKILITCNPKKNWLYQMMYKPFKDGTLPKNYKFIQSLYNDNQYTADDYGHSLSGITDKVLKQRLMFGNWEYEDSENALMSYDAIVDIFSNTVEDKGKKYVVVDVARYGSDRTVISKWDGFKCYEIITLTKTGLDIIGETLKEILRNEQIPYSQVIIDEDGIGGGVVDIVRGVKGFMANRIPFPNRLTGKPDNYRNLKAQCAYLLSEFVNDHKLSVKCDDETKRLLSEELSQIRRKDPDKEGKLEIEPKEMMKEMLGRSPDIADTLIMRMYFELERPTPTGGFADPITIMLNQAPVNNSGIEENDFK